jgi:hypothetical protein
VYDQLLPLLDRRRVTYCFTLLGGALVAGLCARCTADDSNAKPAQAWAGAALEDWANASNANFISDLSACEPKSALSDMVLKRRCWKVIPYKLDSGLAGKMVWAPPEALAPEISITPGVEGWYAIFLGLFAATEVPTTALVRLDTDPAPVPRFNRRTDFDRQRSAYGNTEEVYFRTAKLTTKSRLCFAAQTTGEVSACGVTHIRLVPLTAEEIRRVEHERSDSSRRVLAATNDGFSDLFHWSPRTAPALMSAVEVFRDTDFGTLVLQAPGADKVNYPSQIGFMKGSHAEVFPRIGDRHFVESIRALVEQDINPVKVLTGRAQQIGMRVHVAIRPAGWSFFEPYSDYWESPFYRDNPQWRCEDLDGTPVTRMSWAVPDVRKHLVDLLRELVAFGADGACIVFTRGYPVVLYEAPARELFQKKFDVDPRSMPESDPRIAQFRSDIVTQFFYELRAALDAEQKRRGTTKRLELSVLINATGDDDRGFGVDLRRLVDEKLVDAVFSERGFGATAKRVNLGLLESVCGPAKIPFSPGIYKDRSFWSAVPGYYERSAHGVTVWDAEATDIYEWCWMSRFGHIDETRWRLENLNLDKAPRTIHRFDMLGGQIRNGRFGPHWGG